MKIVLTGSLGHIGKPLTKELVEKGHDVTVISSKTERQKDIEALGATAAIGLLEDFDFLVSAFAGADAVFTMVPPSYTVPDHIAYSHRIGNNYAQAINQSDIKRVVNLSSWGAHLDKGTGFILGTHSVEEILNELPNITITHLRPTSFYYNLYSFIKMIKEQGIMGSNYGGDDKMVMVAPTDIAAVAAEELETSAAGRKVRYVASDERSANEIAHILGAAIGKPDLEWLTFTDEQVRSRLEENGMPAHIAAMNVELGAAHHSGILAEDYERHKPTVMGKVKVDDFAEEFARVYNSN